MTGLLVGRGHPHSFGRLRSGSNLPPSRGKGYAITYCRPLGIDVEGAGEFQFVADFADGGEDLLVHQFQAAHGVLVGY